MSRRARKRQTLPEVIARAEKKLRQAEHFVPVLRDYAMRRPEERMEFQVSATLTAAQSAFYVLRDHHRATFQREHQHWRQTRTADERAFLNRMIKLRDDDVHFGELDATSLNAYVDATTVPGVTIMGSPDAFVEMENPDGQKVRATALMGVQALYIDHAGQRIEATAACRQFIALLRDLVARFKRKTAAAPAG